MRGRPVPSWPWIVAAGIFLVSLPAMYIVGQLAIFAWGFGLWIVPWFLGAVIGGSLLTQESYSFIASEFDGPIITFALFAALQNAVMCLLLVKSAMRSNEYARRMEDRADPR